MDTVTHALIGRLGGKALIPEGEHKRGLVNWMTLLGALPDIDALWSGTGFDYLISHRGITHSILGVLLAAIPIAWLMGRTVKGRPGWAYCWVIATMTMLIAHVFYDVVTNFGTQVLFPFSRERWALDWQFIIDPYFTGIIILGLVAYRFRPHYAKIGLALMFTYTATMGVMQYIAAERVHARAAEEGVVVKATALPVPFSPFHWKGIATLGEEHLVIPIQFGGSPTAPLQAFPRVDHLEAGVWGAVWDHPDGETYRWFSRYITGRIAEGDEGRTVAEAMDLRFRTNPYHLGRVANTILYFSGLDRHEMPVPFRMQAVVEDEQVLEIQMLTR